MEKKKNKSMSRPEIVEDDHLQLEGRNAVLEAINHDKPIDKIFIKKGLTEGTLKVIAIKARERGIVLKEAEKSRLDELSHTGNHQGVIAMCPAKEYVEIDEILALARQKGEDPFIIVLDGITDPHNLGAIIRSAEACGAHGVVIPKRRASGLTGIVAKTSAGAIEHVLISKVNNIVRALEDLKKAGLWISCAEIEGTVHFESDLAGPLALVIGSEGEGVSRLVAETCDFRVKIPMYGNLSSLNASVAAGVLMYEVVRRRRFC